MLYEVYVVQCRPCSIKSTPAILRNPFCSTRLVLIFPVFINTIPLPLYSLLKISTWRYISTHPVRYITQTSFHGNKIELLLKIRAPYLLLDIFFASLSPVTITFRSQVKNWNLYPKLMTTPVVLKETQYAF